MSQPFDCACGSAARCLGKIDGAHSIAPATLANYFINDHILALKRHQIQTDASSTPQLKQQLLQLLH